MLYDHEAFNGFRKSHVKTNFVISVVFEPLLLFNFVQFFSTWFNFVEESSNLNPSSLSFMNY